jgi:hypothetical protein
MRVSRWYCLAIAAALVAAFAAPTVATAALTNDFGMTFIGQGHMPGTYGSGDAGDGCLKCHRDVAATGPNAGLSIYANTQHSRMINWGVSPSASTAWPIQGSLAGNTGLTIQKSDIAFTFGDLLGSAFDYSVYSPQSDKAKNQFTRLNATYNTITHMFVIPQTSAGITATSYSSCEKCHQLGVTQPTPSAASTAVIPNPNVSIAATYTTYDAWAGVSHSNPATSADSFVPGSSIQCESCHGTGSNNLATNHWSEASGIVGFGSFNNGHAKSDRILDSEVCGQCHSSSTNVAGTLGIVGYTPDQPLTNFVTPYSQVVNASYPASGFPGLGDANFYPNGSSKSMSHGYYNEWLESGHSYKGQLTSSSAGASWYQQNVGGQFQSAHASSTNCLKCHTGEGYLVRKATTHGTTSSDVATSGNMVAGYNIVRDYQLTTASAGAYGEECAICHTPHGADAGGVEVRQADAGNASICEDCHNWQLEVLANGTSVAVSNVVAQPSVSLSAVSHPQREVLHGKGLLDVPAGTAFMPGATCEECHMPATYGGSAGSYRSHRMLPMLPGNADAWGVPAGGDSCTPCHAGETRTELQTNIDTWKSNASAASTIAANALSAAAARQGEYANATHATAAGLDLYGRANVDLQFYQKDGSGGVHNPPYIMAGLNKAAQLAKSIDGAITASAPSHTAYGQLFGIQGTITNGDASPAAGITVTLWKGSTKLGTATTDEGGNYAFAQSEVGATTFTVLWKRSSNSVADLSKSVTVGFEKMPTALSIIRSVSSVKHGHTFSLHGELNPDMVGRVSIAVQYKKPRSTKWVTLRSVTTSTDGAYSTSYSTKTKGTWQFRAVYAASAGWLGSTSGTVKVLVK